MKPLWLRAPGTGKYVEIPYDKMRCIEGVNGEHRYYYIDADSPPEARAFAMTYPRFFKAIVPGAHWLVLRTKRQNWLAYHLSIMPTRQWLWWVTWGINMLATILWFSGLLTR